MKDALTQRIEELIKVAFDAIDETVIYTSLTEHDKAELSNLVIDIWSDIHWLEELQELRKYKKDNEDYELHKYC